MGILKNFEGDGIDNEPINAVAPIDLLTNVQQIQFDRRFSWKQVEFFYLLVFHLRRVKMKMMMCIQQWAIRLQSCKQQWHPRHQKQFFRVHHDAHRKWKKMLQNCRNRFYTWKVWAEKDLLEIVKRVDMRTVRWKTKANARYHLSLSFSTLVCFLLNLARDLDEDFASAVNFEDLVETTISAFAQLLLSKSKMKVRRRTTNEWMNDCMAASESIYSLPLTRGSL